MRRPSDGLCAWLMIRLHWTSGDLSLDYEKVENSKRFKMSMITKVTINRNIELAMLDLGVEQDKS